MSNFGLWLIWTNGVDAMVSVTPNERDEAELVRLMIDGRRGTSSWPSRVRWER